MIPSALRTTPGAWQAPHSALRTSPPSPASPLRTPHSALRTSPFTLVEILVVLVVMAILMLIGMPAFEKIAKGQGAELAAREMVGKLKAVRAYAVTNRVHTALILPMDGFPATGSIETLRNRSYRAAVVVKDGSDWKFLYWVPNEKWNSLPTGTILLEVDGDANVNTSSGQLDPANNPLTLIDVDFSDFTGSSGDNAIDGVAAVVFRNNGQSTDADYNLLPRYVHIGEGSYSGGNLVITNRDENAYVSIKIDQFSGRVSYGKE